MGLGHSLLNAVDEKGSAASMIQSQQLQPFVEIGKPNAGGFNLAANGGYDFVNRACNMPASRRSTTGIAAA